MRYLRFDQRLFMTSGFRSAAACLMLTLVCGCMSPEQREAVRQQQIAEDIATCKSYGLRPGSEAFGNCRLQLDIARRQRYQYDYQPRVSVGTSYGW